MKIENFLGQWHSSEYTSNPKQPPAWHDRRFYYPPPGVVLEGRLVSKDIYVTPDSARTPTPTKAVKYTLSGGDGSDDYLELKRLLEEATYYFMNDLLISSPIKVDVGRTYFVDVAEYQPDMVMTAPDDPDGPMVSKTLMAHTLIWQDGLSTMWWCCRKDNAEE